LKQQVTALPIQHVYELGAGTDSLGMGPGCFALRVPQSRLERDL